MREALRLFCLAAFCGSVNEAAKKCLLSPQNVDRQIRGMEIRLGAILLNRKRSGCVPTAAGQYLYEHCHEMLPVLDKLISDTVHIAHREMARFHVGCTPGYSSHELCKALDRFEDAHPNIQVHEVCAAAGSLMDNLRTGKVDVVICGRNELYMQEFSGRAVASVPCYVELLDTDPAAWKSGVELEELKSRLGVAVGNQREWQEAQHRYRDALGLKGRINFATNEAEARKYLSEHGGYRLIEGNRPEQGQGFIQIRLLRDTMPVSIGHYIFWQQGDERREVRDFRNQLRSVFPPELRAKEGGEWE